MATKPFRHIILSYTTSMQQVYVTVYLVFCKRRTSCINMLVGVAMLLHMSYTVKAATVAPVSASISTPVLPLSPQKQSMTMSFATVLIVMSHFSINRGWQKGISSAVRLTARVPAIIAVAKTGPLGVWTSPFKRALITLSGTCTTALALAVLNVAIFGLTSTMVGLFVFISRCVNPTPFAPVAKGACPYPFITLPHFDDGLLSCDTKQCRINVIDMQVTRERPGNQVQAENKLFT
mmetsp:Transcript_12341/g.22421  ORF Transcript_12341/g.22421 Transcript_12341/m.22421 type:complete len:235 (-) Transcript_12341:20-724(-)